MALLLLLGLEVFLRGDDVRVKGVVGLVLHNLLVVRWVHVSRLVAIIRVEWWIRSLISLSLQFCLLLDLLLLFLLLLWLSLLLLVFGWLFVHGPGAFVGLLILEVSLCVSNVFVEWQANWVLDNLFFFVLGPGPWLSAPARGGANRIRFGSSWSSLLLSSGSLHLLLVGGLGVGGSGFVFLLSIGGMARLPLFISDQSGFLAAIFVITASSSLGARVAFLPLLVGDEAGLLPLRAGVIIALALSEGLMLPLGVGVRGCPLEILDQG